MKIKVLHPISHGVGQTSRIYGRGVHDLDRDLAKQFLSLKDASTGDPIAVIPEDPKEEKGQVTEEQKNRPDTLPKAQKDAGPDARGEKK